MDELAKLMDELSVAIKARVDATVKTANLAKEVQQLPKLSVISSANLGASDTSESDDLLYKLQLQLELQNMNHSKEEMLETIEQALNAVSHIRWAVTALYTKSEAQRADLIEEYKTKIEHEKLLYAEAQIKKQDMLFDLMKNMATLEKLKKEADNILARPHISERPKSLG